MDAAGRFGEWLKEEAGEDGELEMVGGEELWLPVGTWYNPPRMLLLLPRSAYFLIDEVWDTDSAAEAMQNDVGDRTRHDMMVSPPLLVAFSSY